MNSGTKERLRYRFGVYEVSPDCLELRKGGVRIKLREQAFRILLLMLERPGELITREELQQRLWPGDTFVNFDKSLNTAVSTLRDVLSDSAANPGFIETIPRHGYRFVAEVQKVTAVDETLSNREPNSVVPALSTVTDAPRAVSEHVGISLYPTLLWAALGLLTVGTLAWLGYRVFWPSSSIETLRALPLTSYTGIVRSPSLSPDGSQVAFSWQREGATNADIYVQTVGVQTVGVQTVGGQEPQQLTDSPRDEFGPAWSPDGSGIAFLKGISASSFDVMLVAPSGGEPRKITQIHYPLGYLAYQEELLTWMPDGRALLFPDAGETGRTAIWSLDIQTGARTQLTYPEIPVIGHSLPSVRGDSRVLVYQQVGGPHYFSLAMVRLSAEGKPTGDVRLIAHGYNIAPIGWIGNDLVFSSRSLTNFFNRWSPSGTISKLEIPDIDGMSGRIGSVSGGISRDGRRMAVGIFRWDVHVWHADILPDGTGAHARKFISSTFRDLNPEYSPDGRKIVFKSTRSGGDDVWIARADGARPRQLTQLGSVGYAHWSPDGSKLVLNASPEESRGNLLIADAETGALHQITHGKSSDLNGNWSHDGHWIYFDSDRTGRSEIWKVSATGGAETQVTKTGGVHPMEAPDGDYLYYGKERAGEIYVWRMSLASGTEKQLFPTQVTGNEMAMDRRHLYFVSNAPSTSSLGNAIYSYDLSTGRILKLVESGIGIGCPAPSPDGKQLLYASVDGVGGDLLMVNGLQKR